MKKLIDLNFIILLAVMLGFAVLSSCDDHEEMIAPDALQNTTDVTEIDESITTARKGGNGCSTPIWTVGQIVSDTITDEKFKEFKYCTYRRKIFTLSSVCGPSLVVQFEGILNSFIRPLPFGAVRHVGRIPLNYVDSTWSSILPNITAKASPGQSKDPDLTCFDGGVEWKAGPTDVMGMNGSIAFGTVNYDFKLGYYDYIPPGQFDLSKYAVVIWGGGGPTDPNTATQAHVIRVSNFEFLRYPGPGNLVGGEVEFDYRQVF